MYADQAKTLSLEELWAEWVAGRRPLTREEAAAVYHDSEGQLVVQYNSGLKGFLDHVERHQPR